VRCNWAQILEGQIDSAHSSSLHSSDMVPANVDAAKATDTTWLRPSTDKAPRMQCENTSYGFRYAAIRKPIHNPESSDYVRITVYVAPFTCLIPPNNAYNVASIIVPAGDLDTVFYFLAWSDGSKPGIDEQTWRRFNAAQVGVDLTADYRNIRTWDNNYMQDRKAMKLGDFTGIRGIPNQDIAMWETMGRIADRSKDWLGTSDIAVARFRKLMVDAAIAMRDTGTALGQTEPHMPQASIASFEGIVPKSTDWRTLGTAPQANAQMTAAE
jgi:phthalate 4,5-dioxygenase oxygenase subunit